MKVKCIFKDIEVPPLIEMNLEGLSWKEKEINEVNDYLYKIQYIRKSKWTHSKNIETEIYKNMDICKKLENEAKKYM